MDIAAPRPLKPSATSASEAMRLLGTSPDQGLSQAEVQVRLSQYGYNEVPEHKPNLLRAFVSQSRRAATSLSQVDPNGPHGYTCRYRLTQNTTPGQLAPRAKMFCGGRRLFMNTNHLLRILLLCALLLAMVGCDVAKMTISEPTATSRPAPTPTTRPSTVQTAPTVSQAPANQLEEQVIGLYQEAGPSVVFISSTVIQYDYFMQPVPSEGSGSGFVYDRQGHIVTNYHVVADASQVSVSFTDGKSYTAEIVGQDPSTDLAVIKIDATDMPPPLAIGDSDRLRVGQFVIAIGNPFGLESTMTLGIISALGRVIQSPNGRFIGEAIQTDAAINPGNSGGPMLNLQGEVVGVNSQIISESGGSVGIGFAVSSNTVRRVVPELIAQGHYPHPWLGVTVYTINAETKDAFQQAGMTIPVDEGVLVTEVVSGGPAASAGIRGGTRTALINQEQVALGGDIITALNGQPIASIQDLTLYLDARTRVGDTLQVTVLRNGQQISVPVTLQERPQDQ
jgi:S1-C subfamily serine protease